jgi:hypothetical protein
MANNRDVRGGSYHSSGGAEPERQVTVDAFALRMVTTSMEMALEKIEPDSDKRAWWALTGALVECRRALGVLGDRAG